MKLRKAISEILRISSAKFITSMAGILAYIARTLVARSYASVQGKLAHRLASVIQGLSAPVDVMEELLRFTLLLRDRAAYLVDRYSERKSKFKLAEAL